MAFKNITILCIALVCVTLSFYGTSDATPIKQLGCRRSNMRYRFGAELTIVVEENGKQVCKAIRCTEPKHVADSGNIYGVWKAVGNCAISRYEVSVAN